MLSPLSDAYYMENLQEYYPKAIFEPFCAVEKPAFVTFGDNSKMGHHSTISIVDSYLGERFKPSVTIGQNTIIGPYNAFAAMNKIVIGDYVLFAPYVHINDLTHGYSDITKPIMQQQVFSSGPIIIENGCWLGFGSHVLSGVTIGQNAVIGANSVVTKDIPPFSVAVGSPAKVVKSYNFKKRKWESPNSKRFFFFG